MNKYICKGAIIQRKNDANYQGVVIALDKKNSIVIAQTGEKYWSDKLKNVNVMSYREVR